MPPQVNARLTAVTGATAATRGRDDWDEPAGGEPADAGGLKWSGSAPAYYREDVRRIVGAAGGADVVEARVLYIDSSVARAANIDTDDVLTYTDPAGVERTARAAVVAIRELAGVPGDIQTARLELELL